MILEPFRAYKRTFTGVHFCKISNREVISDTTMFDGAYVFVYIKVNLQDTRLIHIAEFEDVSLEFKGLYTVFNIDPDNLFEVDNDHPRIKEIIQFTKFMEI